MRVLQGRERFLRALSRLAKAFPSEMPGKLPIGSQAIFACCPHERFGTLPVAGATCGSAQNWSHGTEIIPTFVPPSREGDYLEVR